MTESQALKRYDVHLFPVIHLKVPATEAVSPRAAIELALQRTLPDLPDRLGQMGAGYCEEMSHFLVDVAGDAEFRQSRWFYSQDEPLLANLRRLIAWDRAGRPAEELEQILSETRDLFAICRLNQGARPHSTRFSHDRFPIDSLYLKENSV